MKFSRGMTLRIHRQVSLTPHETEIRLVLPGALPVWQPLLKCGAAEIDPRVKVRVIGVDEGKGVFEYKDGVLGLRLTRGLFIKVY